MVTDVKMNTPLHDLTKIVADCMRKHEIQRASGSWNEYYRAVEIATKELGMSEGIKERIYRWILPR